MTTIRAYHFVGKTLRDGRPVPKDGELLKFDGEPILCRQGLHASIDPFDALQYAPGATLCLDDVGGTMDIGDDKLCGTERTIVRRIDATELLRYFARMQALSVIHLWRDDPPDVVLDYLMTGDEKLRAAAEAAARAAADAAWAAADAAADAAAYAAADAAAEDAADAARDAARAAAWAAADEDAAWAAARAAARQMFNELVKESLG
jgi:hypothetical protein